MVDGILTYFNIKSKQFMQKWQYLLLQEKCRLCLRFIHPLFKDMDFRKYVPPATYFTEKEEVISDALCQLCLYQFETDKVHSQNYFLEDPRGNTQILQVFSGFIFQDPMKNIIYKFKYDSDVLLAKDFACLILPAWRLLKEKLNLPLESICFVPVPLHKKRYKQRGFNQSELLAWRLSQMTNIKTENNLLKRITNTKSQQELNKNERKSNVLGAFKATSENAFANRHIIFIDDVCTSGATLIECAQTAVNAGAVSVYALTIAFVP